MYARGPSRCERCPPDRLFNSRGFRARRGETDSGVTPYVSSSAKRRRPRLGSDVVTRASGLIFKRRPERPRSKRGTLANGGRGRRRLPRLRGARRETEGIFGRARQRTRHPGAFAALRSPSGVHLLARWLWLGHDDPHGCSDHPRGVQTETRGIETYFARGFPGRAPRATRRSLRLRRS
jgi:hypothetical protein